MAENDPANMDWLPQESAMTNIIEHWQQQRRDHQILDGSSQVSASLSLDVGDSLHVSDSANAEEQPPAVAYPDVLLQATVVHIFAVDNSSPSARS
jgi:hypothetical protein